MLKKILFSILFLFIILTSVSYFTIGSLNFINLFFRYHISIPYASAVGSPIDPFENVPTFYFSPLINKDRKVYNSGLFTQFILIKPDGSKFYADATLNKKEDLSINIPCLPSPGISCPVPEYNFSWKSGNFVVFRYVKYDQNGTYVIKSNNPIIKDLTFSIGQ